MARRVTALLLLLFLAAAGLQGGAVAAQEDFLAPEAAFAFSAAMAASDRIDVHFRIAPGYYMYRERFEFTLEPESGKLGSPVFPRGIVKYDPTFERDLEVYHGQVTISLPVAAGALANQTLAVTSQGCADAGLCYPPMTSRVALAPQGPGYVLSGKGAVAAVPPPRDEVPADADSSAVPSATQGVDGGLTELGDTGLAAYLGQAGWLQIVGLSLLLGVLLTFTPCVLPMVPIVLAVVAGDARAGGRARLRGLALAASYVLGVSLVYTALGIAAGLAGASLAAWLQTPWVLSLFAVLLALLALSMFDVFTLQAPVGVQSALNERMARIPGGRIGGALAMGMLSALIVGPCVAAPLAGVLLFISQTGDVALGGTALFAMAWGQGVLLLVLGATSGALLPRAGPWMDGVKQAFGMALLATAWWMVGPVLADWLAIAGWAFLALCAAALMGVFGTAAHPCGESSSRQRLGRAVWRSAGLMLALWGVLQVAGVLAGGRDILRPLAPFAATQGGGASQVQAVARFAPVQSVGELDKLLAATDKPVMLDFYADWCVSCIQMERFTFTDPEVARLMSGLTLLQADVTRNTPAHQALLKRFNLFGPPGILFFDASGRPVDDARVVGFKNAREFAAVLRKVLGGS